MTKFFSWTLKILVALVLVAAIPFAVTTSGIKLPDRQLPTAEASEQTLPPYVSDWVEPAATELAPLTGKVVEKGSLSHPSIAVKIDNHDWARPHFGLEKSDIVFEELVEGGMTRYVAIWHSQLPKLVGPVRSIRAMDPDIASPFRGLIVYSGGQYKYVQLMQNTVVKNIVFDYSDHPDLLYRIMPRPSPHDVVLEIDKLAAKYKGKIDPPAQQLAFSADLDNATAAKEGKATKKIQLRFSAARYPMWNYDEKNQNYKRYQEGSADKGENGKQLTSTNVVVMKVKIDTSVKEPRTVMIGKGEVWVSTAGKTIKGTWSKDKRNSAIRFVDDQGNTIRLAPGNTWIELLPSDGSIKLSN